jgi:hypothetical protein
VARCPRSPSLPPLLRPADPVRLTQPGCPFARVRGAKARGPHAMRNGGLQQRPLTRPQIEHDHHGGRCPSSAPSSSTRRSRARHHSPELRRYSSTTEPITMASPLPNPRITEEEDCLLRFLTSMELAVLVEVEVAAVTTSSTVAAAISSAPVAASSIARVISSPSCSLLPLLTTCQHVGAVSRRGRREYADLHTRRGERG